MSETPRGEMPQSTNEGEKKPYYNSSHIEQMRVEIHDWLINSEDLASIVGGIDRAQELRERNSAVLASEYHKRYREAVRDSDRRTWLEAYKIASILEALADWGKLSDEATGHHIAVARESVGKTSKNSRVLSEQERKVVLEELNLVGKRIIEFWQSIAKVSSLVQPGITPTMVKANRKKGYYDDLLTGAQTDLRAIGKKIGGLAGTHEFGIVDDKKSESE